MYTAILVDARTSGFESFDRHSSVVQFGGVMSLVLDLLNVCALGRSTCPARMNAAQHSPDRAMDSDTQNHLDRPSSRDGGDEIGESKGPCTGSHHLPLDLARRDGSRVPLATGVLYDHFTS